MQSSIAVPDFLKWAYKSDAIRSVFKMIHYIHSIKSWVEPFSISLKGHSVFRAFQLVSDNMAKNISLMYKENSLCSQWLRIDGNANVGIFIFQAFSVVTMNPLLVTPKDLEARIISDLLCSPAIVKDLDAANKEWYLQLYADSKFYLVDLSSSNFFNLGPFYAVPEEPVVYGPNINKFIEVDTIQQHLIRYGILEKDIGSVVIANLAFGDFPFTLGIVHQVQDQLLEIIPYEQSVSDLSLSWIKMPSLIQTISKDTILQKQVTFTQKLILKKRWKIFVKNYYNL